jgi:DNA-binding HxlR family transcriptional regulator
MKTYAQYCPIAHALDLVGERWSLLIVRELLGHGPLRYSDLHARLEGCGTNILASRLRALENGSVVRRRRLPPPAASNVYELTPYGEELRPVIHQLAHWGLRSLGPPPNGTELPGDWLAPALRTAFPLSPTEKTIEFRIGDERAAFVRGVVQEGAAASPDAVVTGSAADLYCLVVERDLDAVTITGNRPAVEQLLETLPERPAAPEPAAARNV